MQTLGVVTARVRCLPSGSGVLSESTDCLLTFRQDFCRYWWLFFGRLQAPIDCQLTNTMDRKSTGAEWLLNQTILLYYLIQ